MIEANMLYVLSPPSRPPPKWLTRHPLSRINALLDRPAKQAKKLIKAIKKGDNALLKFLVLNQVHKKDRSCVFFFVWGGGGA